MAGGVSEMANSACAPAAAAEPAPAESTAPPQQAAQGGRLQQAKAAFDREMNNYFGAAEDGGAVLGEMFGTYFSAVEEGNDRDEGGSSDEGGGG